MRFAAWHECALLLVQLDMVKIISAILLVIVSAVLLLQIDDPPAPGLTRFLNKSVVTHQDNHAYFYLMGIDAPANLDPLTVGKEIIQRGDTITSQPVRGLELPTNALFITEASKRVDALFNAKNIPTILANNVVLLERYQAFINMKGYQTASTPSLSEPMPSYTHLTYGNRLLILSTVHTAQVSDAATAVTQLTENISSLRLQLTNADNLIGKLIYTTMISESIDALSSLVQTHNIALSTPLAQLSAAERDFEKVMSRELSIGNNVFKTLDKNPEFFQRSAVITSEEGYSDSTFKSPAWLVRLLFKPQMSINSLYPRYQDIAKLSRLTPVQFAQASKSEQTRSVKTAYFRNPIGQILVNTSGPELSDYVKLVFDLNAKITILNQTATLADQPIKLSSIRNPYYNTINTAYLTTDKSSICLTGPSEHDTNRCLKVKLIQGLQDE